jgi:predicted nucleotidyltransferase
MAQEDIIIRKVSRLLKDKYGAHSVYVFGSYVQGNYEKERSDLDIAVFLPQYQSLSLKQLTEITYQVQATISSQVELHFLPVAVEPLSFAELIIKTGRKVA